MEKLVEAIGTLLVGIGAVITGVAALITVLKPKKKKR